MEKPMQIKGAVKYSAYQDLLVLISSSAVCNWQYLLIVYPALVCLLYFVEKAWELIAKSKKLGDHRVQVAFQPKAWCNKSMMKKWIAEQWGNIFINPPTTGSTGKILVADVHRAQQTDGVKALLKKKNTELVNVPPGCTSRVQPLNVSSFFFLFFFNWDSLHARLNSHYEAWSYKKRSRKKDYRIQKICLERTYS